MFWGGFITCLFVSLLFFLFSYLIWHKKQLTLIAGFDESSYKGNKDKLAKTTGIFTLLVGILTLILPLGLEFLGSYVGIIFTVIIVIGTFGFIIYINLMNKA